MEGLQTPVLLVRGDGDVSLTVFIMPPIILESECLHVKSISSTKSQMNFIISGSFPFLKYTNLAWGRVVCCLFNFS